MNEKIFCKTLVVIMTACLLSVVLVPEVRSGRAAVPFTVALAAGILLNLLYLKLREGQALSFINKSRRVRAFIWICLCAPLIFVLGFVASDRYDRGTPLFKNAVHVMEGSDIASRDLGSPIKIGWPIEGGSEETSETGHATLRIPVSGIHANGTLLVVGTKVDGSWKPNKIVLYIQGGKPQGILLQGNIQK